MINAYGYSQYYWLVDIWLCTILGGFTNISSLEFLSETEADPWFGNSEIIIFRPSELKLNTSAWEQLSVMVSEWILTDNKDFVTVFKTIFF